MLPMPMSYFVVWGMSAGYDGLISSVAANAKKAGLKQEDRIFSNSSVTGTLA